MYREMTDKEKLDFTSEMITAMQYGGFSAVLKLVEETKNELLNNNEKEPKKELDNNVINKEIIKTNETKQEEIKEEEKQDSIIYESEYDALLNSGIYSKNAISLVKKDNEEQNNKKLNEQETNNSNYEQQDFFKEEINELEGKDFVLNNITQNNKLDEEHKIQEDIVDIYKDNNVEEYLEDDSIVDEPFVKAPVKKLVNNDPWGTADGIKHVTPGQNI